MAWSIGAVIAGNLLVGGKDDLEHRPLALLLVRTAKIGAFPVPLALLNCIVVRR